MSRSTPFLPGISHRLFGRQRRSQQDQLRSQIEQLRHGSLSQLCKVFEPWLPTQLLKRSTKGCNSRQRTYPLELTFWAFLSQVLSLGSSCREIVRKVQAWYASHDQELPNSGTSAYCQARGRVPISQLRSMHRHVTEKLTSQSSASDQWLGRCVKVVDGTGLSMPDTSDNQKVWPQPNTQKPGCGFPVIKVVACFSLATGALLNWVQGTLKDHDCRLFQGLLDYLQKDDIVLTDRGFSSFANLAVLLARGVDTVMRLHHFRKIDWRTGQHLGKRDRVVHWKKTPMQGNLWTREQWAKLPEQITVRVVEIEISVPGFRTQKITLVTTLLDAQKFSAVALGQLYFRRWSVELFFRDIKQSLGMDILRCQSPSMVEKEIIMHAIAYNLIRALMQDIAHSYQVELCRVSFKGTVDALRHWSQLLNGKNNTPLPRNFRSLFYQTIADDRLTIRPNRSEPRAVKRRPKNFRLLTKHRHKMVVERCRKQSQKSSKNCLI
ncbi:MAG: transposase [Verrucomicrobiales bacterium]|nr:transposase [Verrucomicrobiales bacterium]